LSCKKEEDKTNQNLLIGYVATQSLFKNDVCSDSKLNTTGLTTTPTTFTFQVHPRAGGAYMSYVVQTSLNARDFIQVERQGTPSVVTGQLDGLSGYGLNINQLDGVSSCANVPTLSDSSNRTAVTCYWRGQTIPSPYAAFSIPSTDPPTKALSLVTKTSASAMLEIRVMTTNKDPNADEKPKFSKNRF
jgi:hypothetical protein